jgi:simple sugar transport system ATP-binding protein
MTKRFGDLEANSGVDFDIFPKEVHALLGQNGAGKSTLIKVLTGRLSPDAGVVEVSGTSLTAGEPLASMKAGIGAVFQDLMVVPTMTGIENLMVALRSEPWARNTDMLRERIEGVSERFGFKVALDTPLGDLSLPDQQRVALLRALCLEPKVLILDEPTGLLPPIAISAFLDNLRELAAAGIAVLLVTHRLSEMRAVADRLTVMREGRVVGMFTREHLPDDIELARLMVGTVLEELPDLTACDDAPMVRVGGLYCKADSASTEIDGISLEVRRGEIVGLAGVDGNGQQQLLEAIAGLRRVVRGSITFNGVPLQGLDYRKRRSMGLSYLSGDRERYGIIPRLTVADNLILGQRVQNGPSILETIEQVGLVPSDPHFSAELLSGGNQQKLLLGRTLRNQPKMLLLSYPLRGLDIHATRAVSRLLLEQAQEGVAILIAGSDLQELLAICHRIVVMERGQIVGEQKREDFDVSQIAGWLTSVSAADVSPSSDTRVLDPGLES